MEKTYIGIDPGQKGFIAAICGNSREFISLADKSALDISDFLSRRRDNSVAVIEDVHAIFGSSAKSTFSFGYVKGLLVGLLVAHKIPYVQVPPKDWQKEIWTTPDKVYASKDGKRRTDPKATSSNAARRLFPTEDFRRNGKCHKDDDNKIDALLISEYARRKNL